MLHINHQSDLPSTRVSSTKVRFTRREKECIQYLLYGMTAKEIAKELKLSPRTVETYLENIKTKIDCFSKTQLIQKIIKDYAEVHLFL